jgi:hypothetical protein
LGAIPLILEKLTSQANKIIFIHEKYCTLTKR